jgi:hypothetical protein
LTVIGTIGIVADTGNIRYTEEKSEHTMTATLTASAADMELLFANAVRSATSARDDVSRRADQQLVIAVYPYAHYLGWTAHATVHPGHAAVVAQRGNTIRSCEVTFPTGDALIAMTPPQRDWAIMQAAALIPVAVDEMTGL